MKDKYTALVSGLVISTGSSAANLNDGTISIDERVSNIRMSIEKRALNKKDQILTLKESGKYDFTLTQQDELILAGWPNWPNWQNWNNWQNWANWQNWPNY